MDFFYSIIMILFYLGVIRPSIHPPTHPSIHPSIYSVNNRDWTPIMYWAFWKILKFQLETG